jgi:hypothetical protein
MFSEKEGRMKMQFAFRNLMLMLTILLAGAYVYAGEVELNMKQPFKAGGKAYPAGHYKILAEDGSDHINLLNLDMQTDDAIRFTTRLSQREGDPGEVVLDKVDNELYLSEIYIIGMDGFFFQGAPGKHKHLIVKESIE